VALKETLGVGPSAATREWHAALLTQAEWRNHPHSTGVEPVRTSDKEIVVRARLYLLSSLLVLCLLVLSGCGGKGGGY
jgi:hypothetical protein